MCLGAPPRESAEQVHVPRALPVGEAAPPGERAELSKHTGQPHPDPHFDFGKLM